MIYTVLFEDDDRHADQRPALMPRHLAFLEKNADLIQAAGPLTDADTGDGAGGLWIVDAANREEVRRLVEADPFFPSGLRKSFRILQWLQVFADGAVALRPAGGSD